MPYAISLPDMPTRRHMHYSAITCHCFDHQLYAMPIDFRLQLYTPPAVSRRAATFMPHTLVAALLLDAAAIDLPRCCDTPILRHATASLRHNTPDH